MAISTLRFFSAFLLLAILTVAGCGDRDDAERRSPAPEAGSDPLAGPRGDAKREGRRFEVTIAAGSDDVELDGRLILVLATDNAQEPRFQTTYLFDGPQIFGVNVEGARAGETIALGEGADGYPRASVEDIPPGAYYVQAVFDRYDDFTLSNGKTVSLPASWAAGRNWRREPGNLYSVPQEITITPTEGGTIRLLLDQINPEITPPEDTSYVKHVEIVSERLSEFWGREMKLGAHVLLPHGFEDNPDARYPLLIFHGHYPEDFDGFRPEPPTPDLECEYSARFDLPCYNRTVQEEAHAFYKQWTSGDFPRVIIVKIQHANPYYDDSYAVNSANLGPYGDAITYDLIPFIEERFRGLGEPWARFVYGGSTGGWEAMAAQVFYPDEYNGAYIACPDPIDFRAYMTINIYEDDNAYYREGPFGRVARPAHRNHLGHVSATVEDVLRYEGSLGDKHRSGDQIDIWEAVYSPMGEDGYPRPLWDRDTGEIDKDVAEYWRENYDLRHILERDWETLGPKLQGKLNIYTGDMDNYYLNNAVYLTEEFLRRAVPPFEGEIDYGDRAEHCWNGDHQNSNAISRLRYNALNLPKIIERIEKTAPEGADLSSWRH